MKKLTIADASAVVLGLQDEIRRSDESRYDHRLHGVLLVAQGASCREVAHLLGDAPRTVQYWIHQFEESGLTGLVDQERSGRPKRLSAKQLRAVGSALRKSPASAGMDAGLWDGKTLSALIRKKYGIHLGVRQCQRMFRQLGFRLRKPRPLIAHADPERQKEYKKTPQASQETRD